MMSLLTKLVRQHRLIALPFVMGLLVVACGDDGVVQEEGSADEAGEQQEQEEEEEENDQSTDDPVEAARALSDEEAAELGDEVLLIGFTPGTMDLSDFNGQFLVGIREGLIEYGYEFEIMARTPADHTGHAQQLNIVEDMITIGVDHIVIIPTRFESQIASYRLANERGVPITVGNYSVPLPEEDNIDVHRYTGYSHLDGGQLTAEYILENYEPGTKVGLIYAEAGNVNDARGVSVKETLEAEGFEIVGEEYADFDRDLAFGATQDMLTAHSDVEVIYAVSSAMAMGAIAAVEASPDHVPNEDVDIIGFGGNIEELDAILGGKLRAAVHRDPIEIGKGAAEAIHLVREGRGDEVLNEGWNVPMNMVDSCEDIVQYAHPVTFESEGRPVPTSDDCEQ